jgi:hypothetical protein
MSRQITDPVVIHRDPCVPNAPLFEGSADRTSIEAWIGCGATSGSHRRVRLLTEKEKRWRIRGDPAARYGAGVGPMFGVRQRGEASLLGADAEVRVASSVVRRNRTRAEESLRAGSGHLGALGRRTQADPGASADPHPRRAPQAMTITARDRNRGRRDRPHVVCFRTAKTVSLPALCGGTLPAAAAYQSNSRKEWVIAGST